MQYVIAMRRNVRSYGIRKDGTDIERVHVQTSYIPAINRDHAYHMLNGLTSTAAMRYKDGPFVTEVTYEVCYSIHGADGRRLYLDQSEVEMIVSEYTQPKVA